MSHSGCHTIVIRYVETYQTIFAAFDGFHHIYFLNIHMQGIQITPQLELTAVANARAWSVRLMK